MSADAQEKQVNQFTLSCEGKAHIVRVRTTSVVARKSIATLQKQYGEERMKLIEKYMPDFEKYEKEESTAAALAMENTKSLLAAELNMLDDEYITRYARAVVDVNVAKDKAPEIAALLETEHDSEFWQEQDINTLVNMYTFFRNSAGK